MLEAWGRFLQENLWFDVIMLVILFTGVVLEIVLICRRERGRIGEREEEEKNAK